MKPPPNHEDSSEGARPIQTRSYAYDAGDRMLSAGAKGYQYDANGNMTLEKLGDRAAGYSYNSDNRMVSVRTDLGNPGHPTTVSYGYDALGRRVERTADVAGPTPPEAQRYLYDGMSLDVVAELGQTKGWGRSADLSPTTEYVLAAGWGSWMRVRETSYYHTDILGSTRMLSDEHGKVTEDYTYDAFGLAWNGSLSGENALGYTGQRLDPVTGLYDYGYRDYSPQVGRWTTVDPIRAGENWYAYVNDDPINYIDPWGFDVGNTDRSQTEHEAVLSQLNEGRLAIGSLLVDKQVALIKTANVSGYSVPRPFALETAYAYTSVEYPMQTAGNVLLLSITVDEQLAEIKVLSEAYQAMNSLLDEATRKKGK
jgi:RHS repeat-associated protein